MGWTESKAFLPGGDNSSGDGDKPEEGDGDRGKAGDLDQRLQTGGARHQSSTKARGRDSAAAGDQQTIDLKLK